jgi:hypothetical protein
MRRMEIERDQLDYVGLLAAPAFHLFSSPQTLASGLYYAFLGLHSGTESLSLEGDLKQPLNWSCGITLSTQETYRLSLQRVEWTRPGAWSWELNAGSLGRGDTWLRTGVSGALLQSHYFTYSAHLRVEEGNAYDVLTALRTPLLPGFVESYATGAVFHVHLSPQQWDVQFTVDYSQWLAGGIFVQMIVVLQQDVIEYSQIGLSLLKVLHRLLAAAGIEITTGIG